MAKIVYFVPNPDVWITTRTQSSRAYAAKVVDVLLKNDEKLKILIVCSEEKHAKDNAEFMANKLNTSYLPCPALTSRHTVDMGRTPVSSIDLIDAAGVMAEYCKDTDILIVAVNQKNVRPFQEELAAQLDKRLIVIDGNITNEVSLLDISVEDEDAVLAIVR